MYVIYAASNSVKGDSYSCVNGAASVEGASLGAYDSASTRAAPEEALHTFTLDSCASRCFFRECKTVTPLTAPVPVTLADPSGGPVVARSTNILLCPATPSGSLICLHLLSFAKNLVATAVLQDQLVTTTTSEGELVAICTDSRTGKHLATFTRRPGSGLYTLSTEYAQVAESGQVAASGQVCPCPLSRGRLHCCAFPTSRGSSAPLLTPPSFLQPLQTLHMDVWDPARITGQSSEHYVLMVVDNYTRYTMVFPLQSKADVRSVLIRWICVVRLQLSTRFRLDLPVLRLHSDRERRIGFVMEVARTSTIHAAAPYFLWPFAVRYAAQQLNLWPNVSHSLRASAQGIVVLKAHGSKARITLNDVLIV
ncbi:unnamed protein product [Closterium sp. NIES-54]